MSSVNNSCPAQQEIGELKLSEACVQKDIKQSTWHSTNPNKFFNFLLEFLSFSEIACFTSSCNHEYASMTNMLTFKD